MARPLFSTARLRARRSHRPPPPAGDLDSGWLELGGSELRLRRDDGDLVWSTALPDPAPAFARHEFAAGELSALDDNEDPEEVLLERS